MDAGMLATGQMTPEWMDFLIMPGAFLLILTGGLIWLFFLRKPGRRRHKHHQHHRYRPTHLTLAQKSGLPPIRQEEKPPDTPESTF
jgi:hypothetical protein